MKYSPLPWKQHENDNGDVFVKMDESHEVFIGNLEDTCEVCHGNANLIEVAPELAKIAKEWLNDGRFLSSGSPEKEDLVKRTKEVLSKIGEPNDNPA